MIVVWFAAAIWLAIVTSLTLDWVFFPIFLAGLILAMVLPFKFTQLRERNALAIGARQSEIGYATWVEPRIARRTHNDLHRANIFAHDGHRHSGQQKLQLLRN